MQRQYQGHGLCLSKCSLPKEAVLSLGTSIVECSLSARAEQSYFFSTRSVVLKKHELNLPTWHELL